MTLAQYIEHPNKEAIYAALIDAEPHSPNQHWLAQIIASWQTSESALPDYLGLNPVQFDALCQYFFPGVTISQHGLYSPKVDFERMLEKEDLKTLLRNGAKEISDESEWLITLLVTACLGDNHLWQDLGLWQRSELTQLIAYNFPLLAAKNNKNMRWKKFFYKQMCDAEGVYVCRSPSCEVCSDYQSCFDTSMDSEDN